MPGKPLPEKKVVEKRGFRTGLVRISPASFGDRLPVFLSSGALAATFAIMAAISWFRWPDALVDSGRELYVPWRITAGEMLYKDIPHLYGPLAHYFNALLFKVFGTSLHTLVVFDLLLIGVLTWCIYMTFLRAFDRLTATLCGMCFIAVFAFGHYVWMGNQNFVCPYAHEVTYGVFLSFLMLHALERFLERRNRRGAVAVGALLGLIFLTKVEVFLAAFLAALVALCLPAVHLRSPRGICCGKALSVLAGFAAPIIFFVMLFTPRVSLAEALGMVTTTITSLRHASIVGHYSYREYAGLDAPILNVLKMIGVTAVYAALFLGIVAFSGFVGLRGGARRRPLLVVGAVLTLGALAVALKGGLWLSMVGRAFPLLVMAYLGHLAGQLRRRTKGLNDASGMTPMIALSVFSLFLLLKILLMVNFLGYGFALAMPAALIVTAGTTSLLPSYVKHRGGCVLTAKIMAATLVILHLALQADISRYLYSLMTVPVGRGSDRFYTYGPEVAVHYPEISQRGLVMNQALAAIDANMPKDAEFVVLPEGVILNYLTRRRNPGRWFEFTSQSIAAMGEVRMRDDLEAGRPAYVVLTERPTPEAGVTYFGVDFGLTLKSWVVDNYTPVFHAGDSLFSY
jgi:hypothetical protein